MRMPTVDQLALSVIMFTLLLTGGVLSPHAATAATYYVGTNGLDSNPGTQSQPFRTIVKGVTSLHAGDTLYIRQGTYNEQIGWPNPYPPSGTSWSNATTIAGHPGEAVTVAPTTGGGIITFSSGANLSYIIFDNLILDADSIDQATSDGVFFGNGNNHIRISNSEVKNAGNVNIQTGRGSSFIEVINSKIHNVKVSYGFYIEGSDNLFDGNEVYDNRGYAYHIFSSGQTSVSNNIIRNNIIHGNGLCQCHEQGGVILANGTNNQAYNNILYGNFEGFQIGASCLNCLVYNNTIYNNTTDGVSLGNGTTGTVIKNNIMYNNSITAIADRGSVGTIQSNNFTQDPKFVNAQANDFHLQSSSAALHASDTGGEVGAYANGGGSGSGGGKGSLPAPKNLKAISVVP